jgi:hypothetical protein
MKSLGIEFVSSNMNYVLIQDVADEVSILDHGKICLDRTRDKDSLVSFQNAIKSLLNDSSPDIIGIKQKPESGRLAAGAAALKMEGIFIANANCEINFISGQKINQLQEEQSSLYNYLQPAFKAAYILIR